MSDLGSKTALTSDINSKVTTNGANENTGSRVNQCLRNMVDTTYAAMANTVTMGYWNHAANSNAGNCTIAADGFELHPSNTNGEDHGTLFGNYANQTVQVVLRQESTNAYRVLTGTVTSTGGKLTGTGMTVGVTNGTFTVNNPTAVSITRTEVVKTYSAIIREQLGTDPPLPDNEVNRTGLTPTYGYNAAGDYYISMPGLPADQGKVKCQMTNGTNPGFYAVYYLGDEETIQIMTWNTSGVAANDILANASLEIKIDP